MQKSFFTLLFISLTFFLLKPHPPKTYQAFSLNLLNPHQNSNSDKFRNWGLFNPRTFSHIQINEAWETYTGTNKTLVAVIDTGVDFSHPDLADKQWVNPNSPLNDYGWDFTANKNNPDDDNGHGTHIAGIIAATFNKISKTAGIAPDAKIMAVKYYEDTNSGEVNLKNTIKAIHYAVEHGAKIINYSGGGSQFNEDEYFELKKAEAAGVLVVAAAGNERSNTDNREFAYYPAAYRLSNIISVAALDINNRLIRSSNWGKRTVDVAAPGENILSTLPDGKYGFMTGTSQATAFVTGIAALLLSENPRLRPEDIKAIIENSVSLVPGLEEKIKSGGRVNAFNALLTSRIYLPQQARPIPPRSSSRQISSAILPL